MGELHSLKIGDTLKYKADNDTQYFTVVAIDNGRVYYKYPDHLDTFNKSVEFINKYCEFCTPCGGQHDFIEHNPRHIYCSGCGLKKE